MRGALAIAAAGIAGRKLQTGVFAAGCMLCAFFLLSVFVLRFAMDASFDQTYEKLDAPSMTMTIGEGEVNEEELSAFLSRSSCVRECKISKSYLASNVKLAGRTMEFAFLASSKDRVPQEEGSMIANSAVYGAEEGDEAELSINGRSISKTIEAKVTDPVNGAPDTMVPWFWIRDQELEKLTKGSQRGSWYAELKTEGLEREGSGGTSKLAEKLAAQYEETFGRPFDGSITSYGDIRRSYLFRYEIFSRFIVFLSIFLLGILLCMSLILSRMAVRADRKKIGILKATGFTSGGICSGYILQLLAAAVPSGTAGLLLSGILLRIWLSSMFSNVGRGIFTIQHLQYYQILSLLILLLLLYAAVRLSIGPMVKTSPAGVLKEENEGRSARKLFLLPVPRFLPLNLALSACRKRKLESAFLFIMTMGIGAPRVR